MNKPAASIPSGFWRQIRQVNASQAILHQWQMLQQTGCIENFRLAAGLAEGIHTGWFFADSDAYKWLEAACLILKSQETSEPGEEPLQGLSPEPQQATNPTQIADLRHLMEQFIDLILQAQTADGYIFTYNQLFFPKVRWHNLQIEHELYCHGHLIEAGLAHAKLTQSASAESSRLLQAARRAADLIVQDFLDKPSRYTPGHQEIELALYRLWQASGEDSYRRMADQFVLRRGQDRLFGVRLVGQYLDHLRRENHVKKQRTNYARQHPQQKAFSLPPLNQATAPDGIQQRWLITGLRGEYAQQHLPVAQQIEPAGHAVRYTYLAAAAVQTARFNQMVNLLKVQQLAWQQMVERHLSLTGGIGALPVLEGFGDAYDLDPFISYNESCAAIGSFWWSWQLLQTDPLAQYADLMEWQLYNAILPGWGQSGSCYLYNNPLASRGGLTRQPWFEIPCCPSNLSRLFASLENYVYLENREGLYITQYFDADFTTANGWQVKIRSGLPWQRQVEMDILAVPEQPRPIRLRLPSWSKVTHIKLNDETHTISALTPGLPGASITPPAGRQTFASGETLKKHNELPHTDQSIHNQLAAGTVTRPRYDPEAAQWFSLGSNCKPGDHVQISFDMSIHTHTPHPRNQALQNQAAFSRGPLVYCLENLDQPELDLFQVDIIPTSVQSVTTADSQTPIELTAKTSRGQTLRFIPYYQWANRGMSQMRVWVDVAAEEPSHD